MEKNKVSFILPARGGSKGIPGKNIKDFCGKPLIAWQIEAALNTRLGEVFVSSNSSQILKVANQYGAIPISRPTELASDTSTSEDAIINCIMRATLQDYKIANTIIFLQATSPWITSTDILKAYLQYQKAPLAPLIFAKKDHTYPYIIDTDCHATGLIKERKMRQGMSKIVEVGAYIFDTFEFLRTKHRLYNDVEVNYHIIDRDLPPEIDNFMDWKINEGYFDFWRGFK